MLRGVLGRAVWQPAGSAGLQGRLSSDGAALISTLEFWGSTPARADIVGQVIASGQPDAALADAGMASVQVLAGERAVGHAIFCVHSNRKEVGHAFEVLESGQYLDTFSTDL